MSSPQPLLPMAGDRPLTLGAGNERQEANADAVCVHDRACSPSSTNTRLRPRQVRQQSQVREVDARRLEMVPPKYDHIKATAKVLALASRHPRHLQRARFGRRKVPVQKKPLVRMLGAEQLQSAIDDVLVVSPSFRRNRELYGNDVCRILDKSLRRS
jgi:hypothetical protein